MPLATKSLLELFGGTPMRELGRISPPHGGRIWAKLEILYPSGSVTVGVCAMPTENSPSPGARPDDKREAQRGSQ